MYMEKSSAQNLKTCALFSHLVDVASTDVP